MSPQEIEAMVQRAADLIASGELSMAQEANLSRALRRLSDWAEAELVCRDLGGVGRTLVRVDHALSEYEIESRESWREHPAGGWQKNFHNLCVVVRGSRDVLVVSSETDDPEACEAFYPLGEMRVIGADEEGGLEEILVVMAAEANTRGAT